MKLKHLFIKEETETKTKEKKNKDNSIFETPSKEKTENETSEEEVAPISSEEKTWSVLAHLSGFLGFLFPFGNLVGPLAIYYWKRNTGDFVEANTRSAVNFQISFLLITIIAGVFYSLILGQVLNLELFRFFFAGIVGPIAIYYFLLFLLIFNGVRSASGGKVHKYWLSFNFFNKH